MKSNVSLLRRFGAIFYDTLLAFSLVFFIGLVANIIIGDMGDGFFYFITLPSVYLYFTFSWVKGRQTLGMKAWKFQIIQQNQQNITHQQAFVRFAMAIFSGLFFGLGFFYQLLNQKKLTWHDKISKTLLIKN
jgi:uncharacterized RDD family membrane protein YckC